MEVLRLHGTRLKTPQAELRPMTEADWSVLLPWNQDPATLATWDEGRTDPWTLEKLQSVYREISRNAFMFIIEVKGRPIGEARLQEMNLPEILVALPDSRLTRLDLSIGESSFRGRGIGTEVIGALVRFGFDRGADALFGCHVSASNPQSSLAFEKNGFSLWRGALPQEGEPSDRRRFHMILTREAWLGQRS